MDIVDHAEVLGRRALALACLLAAGCMHLPPMLRQKDALDPQEHVRLGASYEAQGLRADASAQYEAAVRLDPACAEGWVALGNLAYADGKLESAETSYRKAVKASPKHPAACNNLATAIMERGGSLTEAETLAKTALEQQPKPLRPYILDTLANIRLRQRRYAEALDFAAQAEAATPPDGALVRVQHKATRDAIQTAAAAQEPPKAP